MMNMGEIDIRGRMGKALFETSRTVMKTTWK
jgi:hypothetical protein